MTRRMLATLTAVMTLAWPGVPARAAETELAIRSISLRPQEPVVRATGAVKLVIDVVARGAHGVRGVTVMVEPGRPPAGGTNLTGVKPELAPAETSIKPALPPAEPVAPAVPDAEPVAPAVPDAKPVAPALPPSKPVAPAVAEVKPVAQGLTGTVVRPPVGFHRFRLAADGWETWRFNPEVGLTRWYPSGAWTIGATATDQAGNEVKAYTTFHLRRETALEGFAVSQRKRVRVSGTLMRLDPYGLLGRRPFAKRRVLIRFREAGGEWRTLASVLTRQDGSFDRRVKPAGEGVYRVEFPATSRYAADISPERRPRRN